MEKFQLPPEYDTEELRKLVELFPQFWKESYFDFEEMKSYVSGIVPDDLQEKYSFTWHGKTESYRLLKKNSNGTLCPCKEESVNWDTTQNLYIEGDNLEVLKLIKHTYAGERGVKMIYIDPPYNTGKDFIYDDNFIDSLDKYLEYTNQKGIAMPEASGRYHTKWLNMMYPRLWLANYLLRDDGVIFISIDDNEMDNLKKLCDEIFGEENFVARIIWQSTPGSNTGTNIITVTEYVLVYSKSKENCNFNTLPVSNTDKYILEDEYVLKRGKHILNKLDRRMTGSHYSDALNYPIEMPDGQMIYPGSTDYKNNENWNYRWSKAKVAWGIANGFIVFKNIDGKWNAYFKQYLKVDNNDEPIERSLPYQNLLKLEQFNSTQGTKEIMNILGNKFFDYPKPSEMIKYLINICNDKDSIILDFFSGSSTTAHAVMQLNAEDGGNRRFICIQLPEACDEKSEAYKAGYKNICEIGKERIRRAGKKILEEWQEKQSQIKLDEQAEQSPPDIGFRVFKLDKSNFRTWDDTPIERNESDKLIQQMELYANSPFVKGRSHEDIVYEVIRINNYPLTTPIIPIKINAGSPDDKKIVYGVGEDCDFIICLDVLISEKEAEELCNYRPGRILFTDSCFENTEIRVNVEHTIRNINAKIKLKVV